MVYALQLVFLTAVITAGAVLVGQGAKEMRALWPWPPVSTVLLVAVGAGFYLGAFFYLDYLRWGGLTCP